MNIKITRSSLLFLSSSSSSSSLGCKLMIKKCSKKKNAQMEVTKKHCLPLLEWEMWSVPALWRPRLSLEHSHSFRVTQGHRQQNQSRTGPATVVVCPVAMRSQDWASGMRVSAASLSCPLAFLLFHHLLQSFQYLLFVFKIASQFVLLGMQKLDW